MNNSERMSSPEIFKLVEYIGSQRGKGYLGNFSYSTHAEFYPQYCDLDIDPDEYEGTTTRAKFIAIIKDSDGLTQAKITEGILTKFPVGYFELDERPYKQQTYDELTEIAQRLKELNPEHTGRIRGVVQNLIFAADGPKPEIILSDATTNQIRIVKNAEYCLVYDRNLGANGLMWHELVSWWRDLNDLQSEDRTESSQQLYKRLYGTLANKPEKTLFKVYFETLHDRLGDKLPALIPQVYLHYDPFTAKQLGGLSRVPRQRMDFLLLFPNRIHVVIEIDGKQHYSESDGKASPKRYAEMVAADRELKLNGYEIFRFGGYEFLDQNSPNKIIGEFFSRLIALYCG